MFSPGIEYVHFFNQRLGLQVGINSAFINVNETKTLVQTPKEIKDFKFFHNFNIGPSFHLLSEGDHQLGASLGLKFYLGDNYEALHYYEDGDYMIYYNTYNGFGHLGSDWGLFYSYKHLSFLLKYDTALHKFRAGIGWAFY